MLLPSRVIGQFSDGFIRVIVGVGIGMLDGGIEHEFPINDIPPEKRQPNSEFFVSMENGEPKIHQTNKEA